MMWGCSCAILNFKLVNLFFSELALALITVRISWPLLLNTFSWQVTLRFSWFSIVLGVCWFEDESSPLFRCVWVTFGWSGDVVCCCETDSFCSPAFLNDSVMKELHRNSWFEVVFLPTFDLQFHSVHKVGGFGGNWSGVSQNPVACWDC